MQVVGDDFVPPQAKDGPCPVLYYLSGLTCTHANVTEKGEFRAAAAKHGIIIVCPDTSPRGDDVPDEDVYFFGSGAGLPAACARAASLAWRRSSTFARTRSSSAMLSSAPTFTDSICR